MTVHSLFEHFTIGLNVVALIADRLHARSIKVPVLLDLEFATLIHFQPMPWHQLKNSVVERFFAREITESQILGERREMKIRAKPTVRQNDFDF